MPDTSSAATPAASAPKPNVLATRPIGRKNMLATQCSKPIATNPAIGSRMPSTLSDTERAAKSDAHGQADEHVAQDAAHEQRVPAWRHFNINSGWKKSQYVAFGSQIGETCSGNQQLVVYDAKQGKQLRQMTLPCNRMTYCGTAADFGRFWRGIPQALSHVICTES